MSSYLVFLAFMGFSMVGPYTSLYTKETLHVNIEEGMLRHVHDETIKLNLKDEVEINNRIT